MWEAVLTLGGGGLCGVMWGVSEIVYRVSGAGVGTGKDEKGKLYL